MPRRAGRIFNLSERRYDYGLFDHQVLEFGFPDHHAPPLDLLWTVCHSMDAWASVRGGGGGGARAATLRHVDGGLAHAQADPRNVVCVHCKAGKGRTGVVCAAFLVFCGMFLVRGRPAREVAIAALEFFRHVRSRPPVRPG